MNSRLLLKKLEESLENITSITRVFEHTAARKMDVNRNEMARLGTYIREAQETYSYTKIAATSGKRNRAELLGAAYRAPKNKRVIVLISSESKYWGNLINSLVKLFIAEYGRGGSDAIVIGDVGKDLLERHGLGFNAPNVSKFAFDDDKPDWTVVRHVGQMLGTYEQIIIFYGQYKSILTTELKRDEISKTVFVKNVPQAKKYGFEPRPQEALALLEKQILASTFLQKLYETGLTKNAVAVKVLEIGAIAERINAAYSQLGKLKLRMNKDTNNRKQTQLYGSRDLWGKSGIFTVGKR